MRARRTVTANVVDKLLPSLVVAVTVTVFGARMLLLFTLYAYIRILRDVLTEKQFFGHGPFLAVRQNFAPDIML